MHEDAPTYLEKYVSTEAGEEFLTETACVKSFQSELYNMLRTKVKGKGRDIVTAAERPDGLKAWNALNAYHDPRTKNESLHAYKSNSLICPGPKTQHQHW